MIKPDIVLYHAYCMDGFGAAYSVWKKYGDQAEYLPCTHVKEVTEEIKETYRTLCEGKDTLVVDFSFPRELILLIKKVSKSFTLIDHHISAKDSLEDIEGCFFDLTKSGALLAWEHFHSSEAPTMIQYISDSDLWEFKLPRSLEVRAFMSNIDRTFSEYSKADWNLKFKFTECADRGKIISDYILAQAADTGDRSEKGSIAGKPCRIVCSRNFQSEIGHYLIDNGADIAVIYFIRNGNFVFSIRTSEKEDASEIASYFPGGGGHPRAAGFKLKVGSDRFDLKKREIK